MPVLTPHTIVNVGYRSTNFWVISAGKSRVLLDLGWPGSMATMRANLDRMGIPLREIRLGIATHFHIDHAGAAQDLKLAGVPLLVADLQLPFIERMADHIKPGDRYTPITRHDTEVTTIAESRARLARVGLAGQLVHTPGHSDDSISLLLDGGDVFTGDLTHPQLMTDAEADVTARSWEQLRALGARTVYPGHGAPRPM